jgi:predicted nucleic acid-binding protein
MNKFFLDTTIIISSILPDRSEHIACVSIVLQNNIPLLTNEYVIKETRRVLEQVYSFDQGDINQFIEFLSTKLEIVKTPSNPSSPDSNRNPYRESTLCLKVCS